MPTKANQAPDPSSGIFATTHWSVVLSAKNDESSAAMLALDRLCRSYWRPVYAYIRRDGHTAPDAQDLTQEFFRRLIQKEWLNHLQHQRGKFRSFLLTFLKHFLSDERDRAGALKRGGDRTFIPLDDLQSEENRAFELSNALTAEQVFERRWAQALMERAVDRLRQEYQDEGKMDLFQTLKDLQPGERGDQSYAELGMRFGLSEGAIKSAMHRLRMRHREILRNEIADTLGNTGDVEEEIQHLIRVLA